MNGQRDIFGREVEGEAPEGVASPSHEALPLFQAPQTMRGQLSAWAESVCEVRAMVRVLSPSGDVRTVEMPDGYPFATVATGPCRACGGVGRREFPMPKSHPRRITAIAPHDCHDCRGTGLAHVHEGSSAARALEVTDGH